VNYHEGVPRAVCVKTMLGHRCTTITFAMAKTVQAQRHARWPTPESEEPTNSHSSSSSVTQARVDDSWQRTAGSSPRSDLARPPSCQQSSLTVERHGDEYRKRREIRHSAATKDTKRSAGSGIRHTGSRDTPKQSARSDDDCKKRNKDPRNMAHHDHGDDGDV